MKVTLAPADQGGCGHYRMIYPARLLEDDLEIEFLEGLPIHRTKEDVPRVVGVGDLETDVLVLQRPLQKVIADAIPLFRKKGITVIVDMDDDFLALHHRHQARLIYDPRRNPLMNWEHLKRGCAAADLVTCSTPAIASRYGGRGHTVVIRNCVPASMLETKRAHDGRTVGWTGYTSFHPRDLTVTRGGVAAAINDTDARMLVVGHTYDVRVELGLMDEPDQDGPYVLAEYPQGVAQFTTGIVPLLESKFNDAKSYLKGMEYAACGVPYVASPTPEYRLLHDEGLGLLAEDKSKTWKKQVKRLLTDQDLQEELSSRGREVIARSHTYEGNAWHWAEAWEHARTQSRIAFALG